MSRQTDAEPELDRKARRASREGELQSRSSIRIVGDALLTALEASKNSAELTAALVREELESFSSGVARRAAAWIVGVAGFGLTTVGLVLGLREWALPWSGSFLVVGLAELFVAWRLAKSILAERVQTAGEG